MSGPSGRPTDVVGAPEPSTLRFSAYALAALAGVGAVVLAVLSLTSAPLAYGVATTAASLAGGLAAGGLLMLTVTSGPHRMWTHGRHLIVVSAAGWTLAALAAFVTATDHRGYWVGAAVAAVIVAAGSVWVRTWVVSALLTAVACLGLVAAVMGSPVARGVDSDVTSNAGALLTLAVGVWFGALAVAPVADDRDRYRALGRTCLAVAVLGGGVLAVSGPGGRPLWLILSATLIVAAVQLRFPAVDRVVAMIALAGAVVATTGLVLLDAEAAPSIVGYVLTSPPLVGSLLTVWRFDLVLGTASLVLAAVYLLGVRKLRQRGDAWSRGRTVAWLLGCVMLLLTTSSGINAYARAMFSVYMVVHMLLSMFIPVLLVLGGPVTLALRALPSGVDGRAGFREWLLAVLHSRASRLLTNPFVAISVFLVTLYGVYFTGIFPAAQQVPWGYELMNVHFLMTGYLFYYGVIGVDPGPRRPPFLARLGVLFAVMPFHAFFGVAVMSMGGIIGESFYRSLDLPWVTDLLADEKTGGAIAWVSGEVPLLLVAVALLMQWGRQNERQAVRSDRHANSDGDADLADYNSMLADLARSRR